MTQFRKIIVAIAILYLVAVAFYFWGFLSLKYKFFPATLISDFFSVAKGDGADNKTISERLISNPLLQKRRDYNKEISKSNSFTLLDNTFKDDGYLLVSRYSDHYNQMIAELFKINSFKSLHQWIYPLDAIKKAMNIGDPEPFNFRFINPILLDNGDIAVICDVFAHAPYGRKNFLMRINSKGELLWINKEVLCHHSLEIDSSGNFIVCATITPASRKVFGQDQYQDDAYAIISQSGKTIGVKSIVDIMFRKSSSKKSMALALGKSVDIIHVNDVEPIKENMGTARIGDLAISMRTISTVILYRPDTDEIIWEQTGPWVAQHDVDILPDGRFSVFDNHDYGHLFQLGRISNPPPPDIMDVIIFDPGTKSFSSPYKEFFEETGSRVNSSGLCRVLRNGDVFVEPTSEFGVLRRAYPDGLRWQYENIAGNDNNLSGKLLWSRYYYLDEIDLSWLHCLKSYDLGAARPGPE